MAKSTATSRRRFLGGAAVAGVATIAMPQVSRAQTVTLKMQSGFGPTDILSDYGRDYVSKVNAMGGGRLKIDFLNSGAVVKPFSVMDATSTGVLDANWSVPAYWYGKHRAASLFGTGPVYGTNADQFMSWFYYGGGDKLYRELTQDTLKLNVVGFFSFAMPTQPLGWFKKPINGPEDLKGLKYRTVGLASNVMQAMGASVAQLPGPEILPAMEKGVIDAFEFNNPTSDSRFGAQDVAKNYYLGSYHQASEAIEVVFNKGKYDGLAKEQQELLRIAVQATSADGGWKASDIYSNDLQTLITKHGVQVKRTPVSVFKAQLAAWDKVIGEISGDSAQGPMIKKILESQKAYAKRVAFYSINNEADFKSAYEHYFGPMKV
ncbi:TRAP transporter substrate-binding protein [Pseudolabrys sp. FHR47]|uniref:TRAP transporter substrate-binding protein n=1 Tax=Pseudolabrys sp. FHR47 TaxID=2562284 RepID=UPI0010BE47E7|nr:TRAP transporter substrate-binding protein [Pseudolabrys sp. FHR47]